MAEVDLNAFSHLTAQNAATYRSIMQTFVVAKQRFVVHLRPEDVHASLTEPVPYETIVAHLASLVEWGNLRADPDTSRVTTVEDFRRARFLYQLTTRGEAVERALDAYDEHLGRRGSLQAVALADIAEQLRALHVLAADPEPDAASAGLVLRDLVGRFGDLADNAQAFMGSLQRTIDLYDADVETFRAYKDRLVEYLERFIKDLVTVGGEIANLLEQLPGEDVDRLLRLVVRRTADDLAPTPLAPGDGGSARDEADVELAELLLWQGRWGGLRQWFISEAGQPSQAKLLRSRARAAIPQLLSVIATLNERRSGRSDRSADLRTLACWFAEAPEVEDMHRLWRVAFGVNGARHLAVDAETLAARDADPVAASTPWASAPPLRISPRLRKTGSYERRGKPNRIVDRAELREALERRAAEQRAQTAAARARLATGGPVLLSDIGVLDPDAFPLFLGLLGDALGARAHGQATVTTTTTDGTLRITLTEVTGGGTATIVTPSGRLTGPEHRIDIADLTAVAAAIAAA